MVSLTIPRDWLSGVYVGKLTRRDDRIERYLVFIVRDDRAADLLDVLVLGLHLDTYNTWPFESSMYDHDERKHWDYWGPDTAVSFDRPLDSQGELFARGASEFFQLEFPFRYWLEGRGYDVTHCSNLDTHRRTAEIGRVRGFLSIGHDEYYTLPMYESLLDSVGSGASIMSSRATRAAGGSTCAPQAADGQTASSSAWIGSVRATPPRSGCFPTSVSFPTNRQTRRWLIGARTTAPVMGLGDWVCSAPDHWCLEGTGMKEGDRIPT